MNCNKYYHRLDTLDARFGQRQKASAGAQAELASSCRLEGYPTDKLQLVRSLIWPGSQPRAGRATALPIDRSI